MPPHTPRHPRLLPALLTATALLATTLTPLRAHAVPTTPPPAPTLPTAPNLPALDRALTQATTAIQTRQAAITRLQTALTTATTTLHTLEASAGLATEAYNAASAQAATATRTATATAAQAAAALDAQHQAERRLGAFAAEMYRQGPDMAQMLALLHADSLHDFATRRQALANYDAAGALAVRDARQATRDAAAAQQRAERAARDQHDAEEKARIALDRARASAAAEQTQVAAIKAQQDTLLAQLAAAQGVAVGLERQRQAALAEAAARAEAQRRAAAAAAASAAAAAGASAAAQRSGGQPKAHRPPATAAARPAAPGNSGNAAIHAMLTYIYAQLGKPYVWGGAGPDVFDCSGLAMRGLEAAGWSFPHPAQWQYLAMHPITYNQLRPGDLVFWAEDDSNPHTIYHEAIYIGNDRIIQAPRPGGVVEQQSLWVNGPPSFYARP